MMSCEWQFPIDYRWTVTDRECRHVLLLWYRWRFHPLGRQLLHPWPGIRRGQLLPTLVRGLVGVYFRLSHPWKCRLYPPRVPPRTSKHCISAGRELDLDSVLVSVVVFTLGGSRFS